MQFAQKNFLALFFLVIFHKRFIIFKCFGIFKSPVFKKVFEKKSLQIIIFIVVYKIVETFGG